MGSTSDEKEKKLTIIHFNDVYNVEDVDFGAARFVAALHARQHLDPLVLFSGDAFNPSMMSTVTKGKQMVAVLNACKVACAVYGNHDFDFGVDTLIKYSHMTNFPWLMSNVKDDLSGGVLGEGKIHHILEHNGVKVGLIGLVEEDWLDAISTIDPEEVTFLDQIEEGRKLARKLKNELEVDVVIALTHMRWPNDEALAREVPEIDIILGGHDHDYGMKLINGKYVLKSGTDFRQFSEVTMTIPESGSAPKFSITRVDMNSSMEEDEEVKEHVIKFKDILGTKLEKVLETMDVDLDGLFENVRTRETNLGNFITDIMLSSVCADCALINSGGLRSDKIHPKGPFRLKDLMQILPMNDPVVILEVTGEQLVKALENGVSQYPRLEGRFPQVAGMQFGFDPDKPPRQRVDITSVKIQEEQLDLQKKYKLATTNFVADGHDGYDDLTPCPRLGDDDNCPILPITVRNHFTSVRIVREEKVCKYNHWQSLVSLTRRRKVAKALKEKDGSGLHASSSASDLGLSSSVFAKVKLLAQKWRQSINKLEKGAAAKALAPKVEGRIYVISAQGVKRKANESSDGSSPKKMA